MEFWSTDRRFGLRISQDEFSKILSDCTASNGQETGGILVGQYIQDHHCAQITIVTTAPKDSGKAHTTFFRGIHGLTSLLKELWDKKREYYLGEWHFHPFAAPSPSTTDMEQMHEFARTPSYRCPEPVMLLIGGDPEGKWEVRAFVFPKGEIVEMQQQT